jgi:hypothetical protein
VHSLSATTTALAPGAEKMQTQITKKKKEKNSLVSTIHQIKITTIHNLWNGRILPQLMYEQSDLKIKHEFLGHTFTISDPDYINSVDYCSGLEDCTGR